MKKILGITVLEFLKTVRKRETKIGFLAVLLMGLGMVYGASVFPQTFGIHNVNAFYANFASILIIFIATRSLGEEYDLKTISFVFTSNSTRTQVLIAKTLGTALVGLCVGFCGGALYCIATIVCNTEWTIVSLTLFMLKELFVFFVYGAMMGSLANLSVTIHNNTLIPFIVLFLAFWVLPGLLDIAGSKIALVSSICKWVIFCVADAFLMYQDCSAKTLVIFFFSLIVFTIVGSVLLEKKDL